MHKFKIETERLILRSFNIEDLDAFSTICADPQVMRYIGNGQALDKEAVKQLILLIMSNYEKQGFGLLAITLKENNKLLGFCGLIQQIVDGESYTELGYRLDRAFWGMGIATEAANAVKEYAFSQLNINYLISIIHVDNLASKRVAEKVGLMFLKQTHFKGNVVDVFYSDAKKCYLKICYTLITIRNAFIRQASLTWQNTWKLAKNLVQN